MNELAKLGLRELGEVPYQMYVLIYSLASLPPSITPSFPL